eukprot:CAMPEP_0115180902 /NCGR_PEP_ID=MMETSP0270-20121206/7158_1 /TAXON_ID=71861 /ORGANISM="Scrippsiella trochoidea, Strain CCMP3099" /LENGTH=538 /DNA_ID=CAMNT_0002593915 /DNA_START=92 /DNA_END=1708 /DNA_ORIENTATION=-
MDVNYVGFNQDCTCLVVAGRSGFLVVDVETGQALHREDAAMCGAVRFVEMLSRTSLFALVGGVAKTQLTMWDAKARRAICTLRFSSTICSVRLNHRRAVVILMRKIHIFDLTTMKTLLVVDRDTPGSARLAALCGDVERGYLAVPLAKPQQEPLCSPDANSAGLVAVMDTYTLRAVGTVVAHRTPVQALCLNLTGELLATASTKGTVVRVFGTPSLTMLYTFRRGVSPCRIFGLSFAADSPSLAAAAASGTVHVFRLSGHASTWAKSPAAMACPTSGAMLLGPLPTVAEGSCSDISEGEGEQCATAAGDAGTDELDDFMSEWNVVPDSGSSPPVPTPGGNHLRAKAAKSFLWQLFQPWQELADAPCAFAWLRLQNSSSQCGSAEDASVAGPAGDIEDRLPYVVCLASRGRVVVASVDGCADVYSWNPISGGEGRLLAKNWLAGCCSESNGHVACRGDVSTEPTATAESMTGKAGVTRLMPDDVPGNELDLHSEAESLQDGDELSGCADSKHCIADDSKTVTGRIKRHYRPAQGRGRVR